MSLVPRFATVLIAGVLFCVALAAISQNKNAPAARRSSTEITTEHMEESRILVAPAVNVSEANPSRPHWEVQIAGDPTNAKRLIACSIVSGSDDLNAPQTYQAPFPKNIVVYRSQDGGQSWQTSYELKQYPFNSDPSCAFGPDGTAYFMSFGYDVYGALANVIKRQSSTEEIMRIPKAFRIHMPIYRSSDAGTTWQAVGEPETAERSFITVDDTKGGYRGRLYVNGVAGVSVGIDGELIGGLAMLHSTDQGRTYDLVKVAAGGSRYAPMNGNGVVMSDGTFATIFGEVPDFKTAGYMRDLHPASPNATLKFVASHDGGETFGKPTVISDFYWRWDGPVRPLVGVPSLAIDRTQGPFHDRLYAAWVDARFGRGEIRFSRSEDKGKTWFPSFVISDNWPNGPNTDAPDAFLPTLAVNRNGVLGLSWYDRRDHRDNLGYDIRFSASLDGGESFLPSVRVSTGGGSALQMKEALLRGPYFVSASADGRLHAGFSWGGEDDGGDTAGLACDVDGVFHPLWVDRRSGVQQVATARITVNGTGLPNGGAGLESLRDLSATAEVHYSQAHLDVATNMITIGAAIYNRSTEPISGPVKLRLLRLVANSGAIEARNADNGLPGSGAVWEFHSASVAPLQPGSLTAPVQLRFKLSRAPFPPLPLILSVDREVIEIDAKILGK